MNSALLKNQGYVSGVMMNSTLLKKAKTFMICIFLKAQKIFLTVQEPFVLYSGRSTDYRAALTGNIPPSSLRSTVVEYSQQITRLKWYTISHDKCQNSLFTMSELVQGILVSQYIYRIVQPSSDEGTKHMPFTRQQATIKTLSCTVILSRVLHCPARQCTYYYVDKNVK